MNIKLGTGIMLACVLCASLTACGRGGDSASGGQVKVAVIVKTLSNPVWKGVVQGAEKEAKSQNLDITASGGTSEDDIQGQIAKVEASISQNVDVIAIAPNGTSQLAPVLERATNEGIKIVLIDTDIPSLKSKTSFVTSEQTQGAGQVAQQLVDALGAEANGAQAGVLDFPGNPTVNARIEAGKAVLEKAGVDVASTLPGKCDRATALNSTQAMLQAEPDLKVIYGACGQNATGAAQAVANAKKDVLVVGFDGINDELKAIASGAMLATVWQDFPEIGAEAVRTGVDASKGDSVEKEIAVPAQVVTKKNVADFKGY